MRYLPWILTVTLTALSVSGLLVYKQAISAESNNGEGYEPSVAIEVDQAKKYNYQETRTVSGIIKPKNHLLIKNEIAGKIAEVNVESGQVVHKGQILLVIEHEEETAKLAAAKAKLTLANLTLNRFKTLALAERISKENVDIAESEVIIAQAEIDQINAIITRKTLRAPFNAFVGIHDLKVGEYLDANAGIVELVGTERKVWVDFYLPQTYPILSLKTEVLVRFVGNTQKNQVAQVVTHAKQVTEGSRQLHYRALLDLGESPLAANQLVRVSVPVHAPKASVSVPALAIVRDQSGEYVYRVNADLGGTYRAVKQKVSIESRNREHAIITAGLSPNDMVATKGAFKLFPGAKTHFEQVEVLQE